MDNLEKLATQVIKYDEKHNKNTSQCVLDTTIHRQIQKRKYDMSPPTNNWR